MSSVALVQSKCNGESVHTTYMPMRGQTNVVKGLGPKHSGWALNIPQLVQSARSLARSWNRDYVHLQTVPRLPTRGVLLNAPTDHRSDCSCRASPSPQSECPENWRWSCCTSEVACSNHVGRKGGLRMPMQKIEEASCEQVCRRLAWQLEDCHTQ